MPDTQELEAQERARAEAIESEMVAQGQSPTEDVYDDYFGFDDTERVILPKRNENAADTWVEFQVMNEGMRRQYLNAQNRKVTIRKGSGDAEMELKPGDDKYNLLRVVLVNWNLRRNGQTVVFNKRNLDEFLEKANPKVIDHIHFHVTLAHPWLLDEMTLEDIDKEIERLQEMREVVARREAGN